MADGQEQREPLNFRQRFGVRRAARADARHGLPTPSLQGLVTTPFREELLSRRNTLIEQCHEMYLRNEAEIAARIGAIDRDILALHPRLQAATDALAGVVEAGVDLSRRRRGDEKASDELVARRRRREHEDWVQQLRDDRARLEAQLADLQRRRDAAQQDGQRARIVRSVDARVAHFSTLAQRDAYDRVLLHKHPQRGQVEHCLDSDVWALPSWVELPQPADVDAARDTLTSATLPPGEDAAHAREGARP